MSNRVQPQADEELLTVIIPCLNEQEGIASTVQEVLEVAAKLPLSIEILMIDDGSRDGTRARMEELCGAHPECRMITHDTPQGIGASVIEAYGTIRPDSWVTGIPGDGKFVFDSIKSFVARRHDYDLLIGYYANPVIRTFSRRMASVAFVRIVNVLYGFPFKYLNGMKLYRASVFQGLEVVSKGHAFNGELLAKAMLRNPDLRVGEQPFKARGRARGQSKAIEPLSVAKAIIEVHRGRRAVDEYRAQVIEGQAL